MVDQHLIDIVKKLQAESKQRKFLESVELAINLKDIDLTNPKNRIQEEVILPNGRGKAIKVVSSLLECLPQTNNYRVLFMHRNLHEVLAPAAVVTAPSLVSTAVYTMQVPPPRLSAVLGTALARVLASMRTGNCEDASTRVTS